MLTISVQVKDNETGEELLKATLKVNKEDLIKEGYSNPGSEDIRNLLNRAINKEN